MNIILGFGKTETDFENQEFDFVEQFIQKKSDAFVGDKYNFKFDEELVKELTKEIEERQEYFVELDKKYKNAKDFPDRYSTYSFDILSDGYSNLCVVFKFMHTNRRHPMSPDGWALLQSKKVYYADAWDFRD